MISTKEGVAWQEWCEERERKKAREGTKVNNFSTFLILQNIQVFSISDHSVFDPRHQSPTDLTNKSAKPKRKKKKKKTPKLVKAFIKRK